MATRTDNNLSAAVPSCPIEDLASLAQKAGVVLGPLKPERVSPRCVLLTTLEEARPSLELSETCLSKRIDVVEVDEGWDLN